MLIKVKVKPNSKKQEIKKDKEYYIISLKSKAKNNRTNLELLKLLSKYFKKQARIKSGLTSKNKIVGIGE